MIEGTGYAKVMLYDSAGSTLQDYFLFTVREEEQIRVNFLRELDTPDKKMRDGSLKRFMRGFRVHIELSFLFDDYVSTTSGILGKSCQEFLVDLHNHTGKIKVIPHNDSDWIDYWVLLKSNWEFEYPFARWLGYKGTLVFEGTEIIDIDFSAPV